MLAPGKLADVIAMSGNLITDIRATAKVDFVMKDGIVYRDDRRRSDNATKAPEDRKASSGMLSQCEIRYWNAEGGNNESASTVRNHTEI